LLDDVLSLILASVVAFVATSLDNLVLLAGFRASPSVRRGAVGGGYLAAVAVVGLLSLAVAAAADDLIPFPIGWLGAAPIAIGLWSGFAAFRRPAEVEGEARGAREGVGFASVFLTMLANSGDSLIVLTALQSDTRSWLDAIVFGTVLAMAWLWAWLSRVVTRQPWLERRMASFGRFGLPVLLVLVGLYILMDTPSDALGTP
jgi:cadmium resistance protein CadD (predicted permease)